MDGVSIGYLHKTVDGPILKNNYIDVPQITKTIYFLVNQNAWDATKINPEVCFITAKSNIREKNMGPTFWEKLWGLMKVSAMILRRLGYK